jgi:TetR/AcrR family transcriptional regulator, tetracycline repressor protein
MALLDGDPGGNLTMRRLARELGVDPMAIYHYVSGKSALLHAVVGQFLKECELPPREGTWQQRITALCHAFRNLAHKHPGPFLVYVVHEQWAEDELGLHEAFHAALRDAGFDDVRTVHGAHLLMTYAEGFAWDELNGWTGVFDQEDRQKLDKAIENGVYPVTQSLMPIMINTDLDKEFAMGLETHILGLEAQLQRLSR